MKNLKPPQQLKFVSVKIMSASAKQRLKMRAKAIFKDCVIKVPLENESKSHI